MDASDVLKFGGAGLSWGGHNIYGDSKSIDLVKQYMHEAGTVPELQAELATLRSENERLKAIVSRWRNTHSCDSAKGYVCAVCEDSDAILGTQATQKGSE